MATVHGNDGEVYNDANKVAETRSWTLNTTGETADDTAQGDTWRTHKPGHKGGEGTVVAMYDPDDTNGQEAMEEGSAVDLKLYPKGNASGNPEWSFNATITAVNFTSEMEGIEMREFSFLVNGAITRGTVV